MPHYPSSLGQRQDLRFEVTYPTQGTRNLAHLSDNAIPLIIHDISRSGCMATGLADAVRGERLIIGLPHAGYRDAFAIWTNGRNTGFQFEKPMPPETFVTVLGAMGYRPLPLPLALHHPASHHDPAPERDSQLQPVADAYLTSACGRWA